jgi:dipeptidyl aminopeptidase/acylaminoacyl peptidase
MRREPARRYISGRDELRLLDLKTLESKRLVTDEFWGFQNGQPEFSPDGNYLLFTAKRDFEEDVFVCNLNTGAVTNLTETGISENGPVWSPDGKYIYFTTSRLKPNYPSGGGEAHIYRMALDRFDKPYRMDEFNKLFIKDSTNAKKDSVAEITINTDRIWERIEQIGPSFGSQGGLLMTSKGDKITLFFSSNHDKGARALWKTVLIRGNNRKRPRSKDCPQVVG